LDGIPIKFSFSQLYPPSVVLITVPLSPHDHAIVASILDTHLKETETPELTSFQKIWEYSRLKLDRIIIMQIIFVNLKSMLTLLLRLFY
jgi:hypothetical protein